MEDLSVGSIEFLTGGKLSVEVGANAQNDPPQPPAVDNIRIRVYMHASGSDTLDKIRLTAIETARAILKG